VVTSILSATGDKITYEYMMENSDWNGISIRQKIDNLNITIINLNWELKKFTLHLCSIKLFIYIREQPWSRG